MKVYKQLRDSCIAKAKVLYIYTKWWGKHCGYVQW